MRYLQAQFTRAIDWSSWPRTYIVANVGSIPLAIVTASERLTFEMYRMCYRVTIFIYVCISLWTIVNDVHLSCNKLKWNLLFIIGSHIV